MNWLKSCNVCWHLNLIGRRALPRIKRLSVRILSTLFRVENLEFYQPRNIPFFLLFIKDQTWFVLQLLIHFFNQFSWISPISHSTFYIYNSVYCFKCSSLCYPYPLNFFIGFMQFFFSFLKNKLFGQQHINTPRSS